MLLTVRLYFRKCIHICIRLHIHIRVYGHYEVCTLLRGEGGVVRKRTAIGSQWRWDTAPVMHGKGRMLRFFFEHIVIFR